MTPQKLLSLYLRAGTGAVRLTFQLTTRAVKLAGSALGATHSSSAPTAPREPASQPAPQSAPEAVPEPGPRPPLAQTPAVDYDAEPRTPIDATAAAAKTADDEPELVAEFAEPGAEDGAHAELIVDEPWEGYARLPAGAILTRIEGASPAELAVIELYEGTHKRRQSVLAAAERRLRATAGPASGSGA